MKPDPSLLTVDMYDTIVVDVEFEFMNPAARATPGKIELMAMGEFAKESGGRIKVSPTLPSHAGEFPFVVRAFDESYLPVS